MGALVPGAGPYDLQDAVFVQEDPAYRVPGQAPHRRDVFNRVVLFDWRLIQAFSLTSTALLVCGTERLNEAEAARYCDAD